MGLIYSLDPCLTYKKNDETENRNHAGKEDEEKDSDISSNEGLLKSDNHARGEQADEALSRASNDWGLVIY